MEAYGCFAFGKEVVRLKLPVNCRTHKATEVVEQYCLAFIVKTLPSRNGSASPTMVEFN